MSTQNKVMTTRFTMNTVIAAAILAHYGEERLKQVTEACQSALTANEIKAQAGKATWNGKIRGGQSLNAAGELKVKPVEWDETEKTTYSGVTNAPLELAKFSGELTALYRKAGSEPSGELGIGVVPKYARSWIDSLHTRANAKATAVTLANGVPAMAPVTTGEVAPVPAPATAEKAAAVKAHKRNGTPVPAAV